MEEKLKNIKLLLLDVDGILTDGSIVINDRGEETKAFHVRDGHGLKLVQRAGVRVGLLTGRESNVVAHRANELGIDLVIQGAKDKLEKFEEILKRENLSPEQVAYLGDDLIDLPVLRRSGFSATAADGVIEVREAVDYVSSLPGGKGVVREVCELVLRANGSWDQVTARYHR